MSRTKARKDKKAKSEVAPERTIQVGPYEITLRCNNRAFRIFRDLTGISLLLGELETLDEATIPEMIYALAAAADRTLWDVTAKAPLPGAEFTVEDIIDHLPLNSEHILEQVNEVLEEAIEAAGKSDGGGGGKATEVKTAAG